MLKERNTVKELLQSDAYGTQAHVKGWVQTKRESKNVAFIALNDGSTIHHLQIVADVAQFGEETLRRSLPGPALP
jgi:asparaginyl-tRNA synthetase